MQAVPLARLAAWTGRSTDKAIVALARVAALTLNPVKVPV
jgi:hypothetical protein